MKDQNKTKNLEELLSLCDPFIRFNSGPWTFLVCRNIDEISVKKITNIFNLKKSFVNGEFILFSTQKSLNHKQKSLVLFFASLLLTSKYPQASACLGQLNVMGERLKHHDQKMEQINFSEKNSEDYRSWSSQAGHVHIGEAAKIYLEQADIQISSQTVMGSDYVTEILQSAEDAIRSSRELKNTKSTLKKVA